METVCKAFIEVNGGYLKESETYFVSLMPFSLPNNSIYYFTVLVWFVLFYNVENSQNKEKLQVRAGKSKHIDWYRINKMTIFISLYNLLDF